MRCPDLTDSLVACLADGIQGAIETLSRPPKELPALAKEPSPSPVSSPVEQPPQPSVKWYRSWWFWTVVGGVLAAGAGIGLGLGLEGPDAPAGHRVIVTAPR